MAEKTDTRKKESSEVQKKDIIHTHTSILNLSGILRNFQNKRRL